MLAGSDEFNSYTAGQAIFQQGDAGDCMYCVKEGFVEIVAGGKVLETLESGHIFGEMALVDKQPRSATARAKTDCQVVPLLVVFHKPPLALATYMMRGCFS